MSTHENVEDLVTDQPSFDSPDAVLPAENQNDEPGKARNVPTSFPSERQARKFVAPRGLKSEELEKLEGASFNDLYNFFHKYHTCDSEMKVTFHLLHAWSKHAELVRSTGKSVEASDIMLACIWLVRDTLEDLQNQCEEREARASRRKPSPREGESS